MGNKDDYMGTEIVKKANKIFLDAKKIDYLLSKIENEQYLLDCTKKELEELGKEVDKVNFKRVKEIMFNLKHSEPSIMTTRQLKSIASDKNIVGHSHLTKEQLLRRLGGTHGKKEKGVVR